MSIPYDLDRLPHRKGPENTARSLQLQRQSLSRSLRRCRKKCERHGNAQHEAGSLAPLSKRRVARSGFNHLTRSRRQNGGNLKTLILKRLIRNFTGRGRGKHRIRPRSCRFVGFLQAAGEMGSVLIWRAKLRKGAKTVVCHLRALLHCRNICAWETARADENGHAICDEEKRTNAP